MLIRCDIFTVTAKFLEDQCNNCSIEWNLISTLHLIILTSSE